MLSESIDGVQGLFSYTEPLFAEIVLCDDFTEFRKDDMFVWKLGRLLLQLTFVLLHHGAQSLKCDTRITEQPKIFSTNRSERYLQQYVQALDDDFAIGKS